MSVIDKTNKDFQGKLDYEEFSDLLWEAVCEKTVSTTYLDQNQDFINSLTFDFYRMFLMDQSISIRVLARLVEYFFFNFFKFDPEKKNVIEIQDNY